jgi:undecaprenyl-diphosphatase
LFARRGDGIEEIDDGWTSAVSSGFALAGFLSLVFVAFTLLAMGPLVRYDAYFNLEPPPAAWVPFLHVLDRVGQRAVALPILGAALYYIYRRRRSWRPVVVAGVSVFTLNLVVLVLKVALGRSAPYTADPSFFAGGMAYPSGHSANIVLMYGLVAYLVSHYTSPSLRTKALMWGTVAALAVTMVVTSLTLNWHWFADLVAGLLVGGIVLELTASVDRLLPVRFFAAGGRAGVRAAYADALCLLRSALRRPQGQ